MLLLNKAFFSLLISVPCWFGLSSSGTEIQVRIPVWNVGNIFSDLVKGQPTTTGRPTRPPTRSTRPTRSTTTTTKPPTKPTHPSEDICDVYPQLPACQEEVTPEPSICDIYPELPLCQEETNPPEPSICDTFPELPLCQEESVRNSQVSDDPNFCLYYPTSCSNAEEKSSLVPLVDRQGRPLLMFLPGARGKKVPVSGRSSTGWLGPTRRPLWQRQSKKDTLQGNPDK